jgi:cytosine/adenosine deaminase-related metal-dependent hydrolase
MAGLFPPQKSFCDWIKLITTEKAQWTFSDYANSWIAGAKMLLQSGTTTVADIEAVPELLPDVWNATPLRVLSFLEMTGIRSRREPRAILAEAVAIMDAQPPHRGDTGLSPHAPYSTSPRLLEKAAALARKRNLRLVTHVAESATEFEMFTQGRGEMFDWLRRNRRDMSDCDGRSPVQHLARCDALGPHLLAVHVNYLAPGDAALLARKRVSVVHCPGSHDYFRHQEFPRRELARAGVNVCLGTDSLATVRKQRGRESKLNLFYEMRAFAARHPDVPPRQILRMTTLNAARAVGLAGKAGEIRPGAFADLIALPLSEKSPDNYTAILQCPGEIAASMIGGEWAKTPH